MNTRLTESTIQTAAVEAMGATASAAITWAVEHFGDRLCILSSMQDTTLVDIAMSVDRNITVTFIDTGYHFDETLQTLAAVEARYGINVEVIAPLSPVMDTIQSGECCADKAAQLEFALRDRDAWITGIQRHQTENRSDTPIVSVDRRSKIKISPLAQWSDADIADYGFEHGVIRNPLFDRGYTSIGCRTCTTPPADAAADQRSGRWAGTEKTECGLHL